MLAPIGIRLAVLLTILWPLIQLGGGLIFDRLGANPIEALLRGSGDWTLRLLLLTLLVTPLVRYSGWRVLLSQRRRLGVASFCYGVLHLTLYLVIDQQLHWPTLLNDLLNRPFITLGMVALLLLLPLAITSTNGMMRRLGGRRWRALHQLVWPALLLALIHFWLLIKADPIEPLLYTLLALLLYGLRRCYR